ncbi:MAG: hypothetical protein NT027_01445 [Proteobacteria bacterium]|nr:hypothetical protein [Pseudomonadota bacterium]
MKRLINKNSLMVALTTACLAGLNSCGSKIKGDNSASNRLIPGTTPSKGNGDGDAEGKGCKLQEVDASFAAKGFKKIDINSIKLSTPDKESKSLCQYLRDYDNEVAIVQFSGVLCLSCQDEGKHFTEKLKNPGPHGNNIGHMVALTDLWEDFTATEFKDFMKKYAPQSIQAHDGDSKLWKYFSLDPLAPTRPTVLAFDRRGWSYLVNVEGTDPMTAYDAAVALFDKSKVDNVVQADIDAPDRPNEGDVEPIPTIAPDPNNPIPTPSVAPTPSGKQINLAGSQNFSMTDSSGAQTTLSQYFENNDYLVIDISQYNCTYCIQLANKHQSDTAFQTKMQSGKCKTLTTIPSSDMTSWGRKYSSGTFIGKTTKGVSSIRNVASAFGINFGGTPTVFMIDRQGKVVGQQVGGMPSQATSLCN